MSRAFGLDLAGFSTGKSELAVAEHNGDRLKITLLTNNPFARLVAARDRLSAVVAVERSALSNILGMGSLAVDVPIDLQGLPFTPTSEQVWGLTKRPIDFALNALPPFADRIGSVVARFQAALDERLRDLLAVSLFETYPAACLVAVGHRGKGYKGPDGIAGREEVSRLLMLEEDTFSDDELDAIICALTALGPNVLEGPSLEDFLSRHGRTCEPPRGYRLLATVPRQAVRVRREQFDAWIGRQRPAAVR